MTDLLSLEQGRREVRAGQIWRDAPSGRPARYLKIDTVYGQASTEATATIGDYSRGIFSPCFRGSETARTRVKCRSLLELSHRYALVKAADDE